MHATLLPEVGFGQSKATTAAHVFPQDAQHDSVCFKLRFLLTCFAFGAAGLGAMDQRRNLRILGRNYGFLQRMWSTDSRRHDDLPSV